MSKFNFNGKALFLTYKSHLTKIQIEEIFESYNSKFDAVHESSDKEHSYDHTHILVWFNKKTHIRNSRALDIGEIHPHMKIIKTRKHWENLTNYIKKQNDPFIKKLTGNEYEWLGSVRDVIQSHNSWGDVINDDSIGMYLQKYMNWAKECWMYRPRKNLTKDIVLREWQKWIVERLDAQNNRQILWVYDKDGAKGKSVLTNWLMDNRKAFMFNGGRMADIAHAYNEEEYVVVDLPRSMDQEFTPYKAMECFKDGRIFSPKYNSCMKRFKSCKVVVFSNNLPNRKKLSEDRWDIIDISSGSVVPVSLNIKGDTLEVEKVVKTKKRKKLKIEEII